MVAGSATAPDSGPAVVLSVLFCSACGVWAPDSGPPTASAAPVVALLPVMAPLLPPTAAPLVELSAPRDVPWPSPGGAPRDSPAPAPAPPCARSVSSDAGPGGGRAGSYYPLDYAPLYQYLRGSWRDAHRLLAHPDCKHVMRTACDVVRHDARLCLFFWWLEVRLRRRQWLPILGVCKRALRIIMIVLAVHCCCRRRGRRCGLRTLPWPRRIARYSTLPPPSSNGNPCLVLSHLS